LYRLNCGLLLTDRWHYICTVINTVYSVVSLNLLFINNR
jgi:hypothetical protein